ncbi:unnamed protein product [Triticum turgidum subsp. durum]|uniref:Rieske domain-containing protein n=1 Tax=Triticum turgidum subsp. durum TaxID=4567 RepID=A0A9R0U202_TRITD|nr:unnamed protein product [Triticum turgidum subsp. durum]
MDSLSLLVPRARPSLPLPLPLRAAAPATSSARAAAPAPRRWRQRARLSSPVSAVAAEAPSAASLIDGEEKEKEEGQFDWLDQWYPLAPVCDLDPGAPHGKTVLGLRVVAWYDRAVDEWRVFDDACPHRLAPLSEGRIDDKGRLQCVYHGWCFDGRGACQFIPQAPALGPPVHKNSKACVASYPSVVQNNILWFYPVSPGKSRVIWAFPRNVGVWLDKVIPRWYYHIGQNAILDSDIYLLHIEERNFAAAGVENWQKAVYVPTSSDNMVIAFRNWFRKHCKSQVGWAAPTIGQLPETPTKDKLMERYWSHVAQCRSCSAALKTMKALEVALQVASVAVVGFLAVAKGTLVTSVVQRAAVVSLAVLCFAASRWLASFIEKNFYFQDYVHAYK